jgi:membrane associated rhomboid family serine protease
LGTVYKDRVSSHLSDGERQERFRAFIRQSEDNYRRLDLGAFTYLERVGISDDRRGLEEAVKRSPLFPPDASFTVLLVHHDNFDERNGSKLAWVLGSFGIGSVIWFIMLAFAPIDRTEMNRLLRGEKTATAPAFPYSRFFIPRGGYFVTPILIDFNVLVFVVMVFAGLGFTSFATKDLFAWGGNLRSAVLAGQSWRLVTSMFIHGGAMHLVGNLFGLFLAGTLLEPVFGRIGFLLCYFLSGVAGGVASVDWHANTVSIGASGAIFGLMGAIVGFSLLNHSKSSFAKNHVIGFVLFFLGYNFLLGLFGGATDNADHLGGLACGLMLGVFFHLFPSLLPHRHPVGSKSEAHP